MWTGYEQLLRIYDLEKLDAAPIELDKAEDKIRIATWHQQDHLLLSSMVPHTILFLQLTPSTMTVRLCPRQQTFRIH